MSKKPIEELADYEIFGRDPEDWDEEHIKSACARLEEIIPKMRARRKKLKDPAPRPDESVEVPSEETEDDEG